MTGYILGIIGTWILSDAIYSYSLYANAPTYDNRPKQTWRKDHWVRAVRGGLGIIIIAIGGSLV
jgi:hypothetical protein